MKYLHTCNASPKVWLVSSVLSSLFLIRRFFFLGSWPSCLLTYVSNYVHYVLKISIYKDFIVDFEYGHIRRTRVSHPKDHKLLRFKSCITVSTVLEAAASIYFDVILEQILLSKKCVLLRLLFEGGFYSRAASNTDDTVLVM